MRIGAIGKFSVAAALFGAALALAAQTADPSGGGTGSDTGSSGSATSGGKAAAATAGTPASTPTTCTVSADSASAGAADKSGSGSKAAGTTTSSGQTISVQATVTSGGTSSSKSGNPGSGDASGSGNKSTQSITVSLPLDAGMTNAAAIAGKLPSISSRVLVATAVNPSLIVAVLDTSPVTSTVAAPKPAAQAAGANGNSSPAPQPAKPGDKAAADPTAKSAQGNNGATANGTAPTSPSATTVSKPFNTAQLIQTLEDYIGNAEGPAANVFAVSLPPGTGKACDVATALVKALPEIQSITAIDDSRLLVTQAEDGPAPPAELVALVGDEFAPAVHRALETVRRQPPGLLDVAPLTQALRGWQPVPATPQTAEIQELAKRLRTSSIGVSDERKLIGDLRALNAAVQPNALDRLLGGAAEDVRTALARIAGPVPTKAQVARLRAALQSWSPPPVTRKAADVQELLARIAASLPSSSFSDRKRLIAILNDADESLEARTKRLVAELAAPTSPTAATVETRVQKLYYIHDPAAVATLIKAAYPNLQAQAMLPDMVVLSDGGDLDDDARSKALSSALRTVTRLDQPHPQVSVDAWVLQMATQHKDAKDMHEALPELDDLAGAYNAAIDKSIGGGWTYLSEVIGDPDRDDSALDPLMRAYLTYTTRVKPDGELRRVERPYNGQLDPYHAAPDFANGKTCDSSDLEKEKNRRDENCGYGLGFASLYYPLTPNLIDMLVALSSVNTPTDTAANMLTAMGTDPEQEDFTLSCTERDQVAYARDLACDECTCGLQVGSRCTSKASGGKAGVTIPHEPAAHHLHLSCVADALVGEGGLFARLDQQDRTTASESNALVNTGNGKRTCSQNAAARGKCPWEMRLPRIGKHPSTSQLGQFRAALADFLFQYKLMVQYPDEFHSYLEPMAADTLDSAFAPIVSAFDQDLGVFEEDLQKRVSETLDKYKKTLRYGYGGLVSVKVLGSQTGSVTTATQNYFDATPAPTLNDFFTNLQAEGASIQKTPLSPLVTSLVPAKAVELLTVLGQTLTPKPTTAELGRGLDLTVTAHTLSGAYGAELDLAVQSTENGAGLVQAGAVVAKDDLNSRVSQHTVNTHIRVDSLRLFKVSTMSSTLARAQAPWKFIDPLFEVPALGQLIKKPRPPELVDTQSMIFVDAVVVPTAADLGTGVPIIEDQLDLGGQRYRRLKSLNDFPRDIGAEILQYHQAVVDCLNREYIDAEGVVKGGGRDGTKCAPMDFPYGHDRTVPDAVN